MACIYLMYILLICTLGLIKHGYTEYVYDRPICTGLGDRLGDIMSLATMAKIQSTKVVFQWCTDPSIIFQRIHEYIPKWSGYQYDLNEFMQRFTPPPQIEIVYNFSINHKKNKKVKYEGVQVPSEAGLNMIYTTAWKAMHFGNIIVNTQLFKTVYREISVPIVKHVQKNKISIVKESDPYVVLHMRGPDNNTYIPFLNSHDHYKIYCTGKVYKKLSSLKIKIIAITNNVEWLTSIINKTKIKTVINSSAYDDFALLLGATGIIQHALHGWSAYSAIPSMMAQIPLITTYKRSHEHHRFDIFETYGGIPEEFYHCDQINDFVNHVKIKLKYHKLEL